MAIQPSSELHVHLLIVRYSSLVEADEDEDLQRNSALAEKLSWASDCRTDALDFPFSTMALYADLVSEEETAGEEDVGSGQW